MADVVEMTREQELAEQFKEGLASDAAVKLQMAHEGEVASLKHRVEELETALKAKSKRVRSATAMPAADKPRRFAPIAADNALDRGALKALVEASDDVQVAFTDAKGNEVKGAPAFAITGGWREHPLGLMLDQPVEIDGPGMGQAGFPIAGYALLVDGKHVATTVRTDVVNIAPGTKTKLENDIWF